MRSATILVMICLAATVSADPMQWPVSEGGNGHYYEFVLGHGSTSWNDACEAASLMAWDGLPGHLVTLTSAEENAWVFTTFNPQDGAHVGGRQLPDGLEPDGGWTWITGEDWDYENWHSGEPNNSHVGPNGEEDGLRLNYVGGWNDYDIDYLHGTGDFIVEYESAPVAVDKLKWGGTKALYQ